MNSIHLLNLSLLLLNLRPKCILNLVGLPRLNIRVKHHINLLQRPTHSLGVHEENVESHHAAEYTKDYVCLPLDVVKCRGYEVGQGKIKDPVCGGREADSLSTVLKREDF